jgi:hypothetical protein
VSTLLVPKPARTSFWTRKVSSLAQRLEVIPPSARAPYCALIAWSLPAVNASASSQLTSRQGSSMASRIIGLVMRSAWLA